MALRMAALSVRGTLPPVMVLKAPTMTGPSAPAPTGPFRLIAPSRVPRPASSPGPLASATSSTRAVGGAYGFWVFGVGVLIVDLPTCFRWPAKDTSAPPGPVYVLIGLAWADPLGAVNGGDSAPDALRAHLPASPLSRGRFSRWPRAGAGAQAVPG